jgi:anti-sigma regulatory factor (Ser/Thr protein kinase)
VLAFSDGLTEAQNPGGEMFGQKRVEEIFCDLPDAADVFDRLILAVGEFTQGELQTDDMTVVEILHDGDHPEDDFVEATEAQVGKRPAVWDVSFEFGAEALRSIDPLPLLVQVPTEIQGLELHGQRLYTILAELFRNALEHGLLGLDSALKQTLDGFEEFYELRSERLAVLAEGTTPVRLRHEPRGCGGRLSISVEDSGPGFDYERRVSAGADLHAKSGRGIVLVRALCTEFHYRGTGSRVEAVYDWETE